MRTLRLLLTPFLIVCLSNVTLLGQSTRIAYPAVKHGGNYMFNYYLPPSPSTSPWAPAWSPDGKWIAVAMFGSIWRVDVSTGGFTELVYNSKYLSSPTISPDGEWMIYTADDDAKSIQLEIVNLRTGQSQALTHDEHLYLDPTFSRDGTKIAYVSTLPNGYFNVFVRPISKGQWSGQPIPLTSDHNFGRDRLYFGPWDMQTQPAWLPGSAELLLVSNRDVALGSGDIWHIPSIPFGLPQGRPILKEQTLYRSRPDVSVDGKRLVYSSTCGAADQFNHLYVLPIEGGVPYKLTFGEYDDFHPRWSPDGEHIAFVSNRHTPENPAGLPQLWILETYGGKLTPIHIRKLDWKRLMGRVKVQVRDNSTGTVTPARIYAQASDSKSYASLNTYARVSELGEHFFHTSGEFLLEVPAGLLKLEAVKGFEFWPVQKTIDVIPNQTVPVELRLKRMVNFAAKHWANGSTHVHMNYGGNLHNTLENLILMSKAENQNVLNELVANKDNRVLDWQYFVPGGGEHPVSKRDPEVTLIVGEEYRPPFYGHVFFIGLRDHLISPFTTGYEGTAIDSLYPSNTDMFVKAKAQGAAVGYVHAFSGESDPLESDLGVGRAFPVDAALGSIHAMEWSTASRAALRVWHHALNNDLPIAVTGGEDSITSLHRTKTVGSVRTYAFLSNESLKGNQQMRTSAKKPWNSERWIGALKQGKTFYSSGPLLEFSVNGRIPGERLDLPRADSVNLVGEVWSIVPLERVIIYSNGKPWKDVPLLGDRRHLSFRETAAVASSSWFSLTAEGPPASHPIDVNYPQATTSAIRVYVGQQPIRNRSSAEYFIRWIDKLKAMADTAPGWRSRRERDHVLGQFDAARQVYERFAKEANALR